MKRLGLTTLEATLFAWTAFSVVIAIWVLATSNLQVYGSGISVIWPSAVGLLFAGFLLWKLRKPTRAVLAIAAFYWALQIVTVRFPHSLYSFSLGLSLNLRITDSQEHFVSVNAIAFLMAILFAVAAGNRPSKSVGAEPTG